MGKLCEIWGNLGGYSCQPLADGPMDLPWALWGLRQYTQHAVGPVGSAYPLRCTSWLTKVY